MSHPAHIDRFRIVRPIGAGGMGIVYEALDPEIERRVAIKVLRRDLLDENPELLQRLFVEARAANAIGHPGVVQISEAKRLADGTGYLVMELLQGQTLTQYLRQAGGSLRAEVAIQLAVQVASTLRAGHQQGVIHRDLKPDNIMLVSDDAVQGGERIKLLDFGIAKLLQDTSSAAPLTLADMGLGTPGYMAPEQMRDAAAASARSDVYGLGAVLFEMLSGRRPHTASNPADLVVLVLSTDAPVLTAFVPGLPLALTELLAHMLRREPPEARPDMVEVLRRLYLVNVELDAQRRSGSPAAPEGTPSSGAWAVAPPTLLPSGLAPVSLPPNRLAQLHQTGMQEVAQPSSSTPSQIKGQDVRRPARWGIGIFTAVAALALIVSLLWHRGGNPPGSNHGAGITDVKGPQQPSLPTVNQAPQPGPTVSTQVGTPPPNADGQISSTKPPIPEQPATLKHPTCEARPPKIISPADPGVTKAVQEAIKAYHLRLCKGERLVIQINSGDGSLSITKAPPGLKSRSWFDADRFVLRIQGRLAASSIRDARFSKITIAF